MRNQLRYSVRMLDESEPLQGSLQHHRFFVVRSRTYITGLSPFSFIDLNACVPRSKDDRLPPCLTPCKDSGYAACNPKFNYCCGSSFSLVDVERSSAFTFKIVSWLIFQFVGEEFETKKKSTEEEK